MKNDYKLELASNWKNNGFYFHCRNYHPHEHRHLNLHHVLEGMENDFNYFCNYFYILHYFHAQI